MTTDPIVARRLHMVVGDIVTMPVAAVVNAANTQLLPGGGVCGAIHRAAGAQLAQACAELAPIAVGAAVLTDGFDLEPRKVIHAVGPVWEGGLAGEAQLLRQCYRSIGTVVAKHQLASVAIPTISAGIYGYPLAAACDIAVSESLHILAAQPQLDITLVAFTSEAAAAYTEAIRTHDARAF